ncbi:phosphopantetheine-binding protein [Streptomyces sp. 2A115]|uniref:phosphopantetheine-binding protein n=1 Tax=Streptomyces sp. 2A115 TaxID=3457439 RepID=UPI003FD36DA4
MTAALTKGDFADLVRDEVGIDVAEGDLGRGFDELPGWDSVHLLSLLVLLEKELGNQLSLPDFLEAGSLDSIYEMVTR